MPRLVVCIRHQSLGYPRELEATPTAFDLPGALSCGHVSVAVYGAPAAEHLDCKTGCRWASDPTPGQIEEYPELVPAVEKALGTVGDPTLKTPGQNVSANEGANAKRLQATKPKKENNMPKTKTTDVPQ